MRTDSEYTKVNYILSEVGMIVASDVLSALAQKRIEGSWAWAHCFNPVAQKLIDSLPNILHVPDALHTICGCHLNVEHRKYFSVSICCLTLHLQPGFFVFAIIASSRQ